MSWVLGHMYGNSDRSVTVYPSTLYNASSSVALSSLAGVGPSYILELAIEVNEHHIL